MTSRDFIPRGKIIHFENRWLFIEKANGIEPSARNAGGLASASTTAEEASCWGSSICEHNRERTQCKECGGRASASTIAEGAAARIAGRRRTSASEQDRREATP